eukprot:XP_001694778.1 predicted protein [Chlamydomonas reinhardtii]
MATPEQEGAAGEELFPHQRSRLQALVSHFGFSPHLQRPGKEPLFIQKLSPDDLEDVGSGTLAWPCSRPDLEPHLQRATCRSKAGCFCLGVQVLALGGGGHSGGVRSLGDVDLWYMDSAEAEDEGMFIVNRLLTQLRPQLRLRDTLALFPTTAKNRFQLAIFPDVCGECLAPISEDATDAVLCECCEDIVDLDCSGLTELPEELLPPQQEQGQQAEQLTQPAEQGQQAEQPSPQLPPVAHAHQPQAPPPQPQLQPSQPEEPPPPQHQPHQHQLPGGSARPSQDDAALAASERTTSPAVSAHHQQAFAVADADAGAGAGEPTAQTQPAPDVLQAGPAQAGMQLAATSGEEPAATQAAADATPPEARNEAGAGPQPVVGGGSAASSPEVTAAASQAPVEVDAEPQAEMGAGGADEADDGGLPLLPPSPAPTWSLNPHADDSGLLLGSHGAAAGAADVDAGELHGLVDFEAWLASARGEAAARLAVAVGVAGSTYRAQSNGLLFRLAHQDGGDLAAADRAAAAQLKRVIQLSNEVARSAAQRAAEGQQVALSSHDREAHAAARANLAQAELAIRTGCREAQLRAFVAMSAQRQRALVPLQLARMPSDEQRRQTELLTRALEEHRAGLFPSQPRPGV